MALTDQSVHLLQKLRIQVENIVGKLPEVPGISVGWNVGTNHSNDKAPFNDSTKIHDALIDDGAKLGSAVLISLMP